MKMKKAIAFIVSITMVLTMSLCSTPVNYQNVKAAEGRAYNQADNTWKNYYYGGGNLYDTGCGIFSFANAIWALNGRKVDVPSVASWANSIGAYNPNNSDEGTFRYTLYDNIESVYGESYAFKVNGYSKGNIYDNRIRNHLSNGGVAVAHVSGHFIAITGYNNNMFHVIESFVWSGRGLSPDSWVDASKLNSGNTNVDWFVLLESSITVVKSEISNGRQKHSIDVEVSIL